MGIDTPFGLEGAGLAEARKGRAARTNAAVKSISNMSNANGDGGALKNGEENLILGKVQAVKQASL